MPKAEQTLINWQDANSDKLDELKRKLNELEKNKKTKKDIYKDTKEVYEKLKLMEDKKKYHYDKLVAREEILVELLQKCNERLSINLDDDLAEVQSRITFLEGECKKYENQLKQLKAEKKTATENYKQVEVTISNKKQELEEAKEKKVSIQRLIEHQKRLQSEE